VQSANLSLHSKKMKKPLKKEKNMGGVVPQLGVL